SPYGICKKLRVIRIVLEQIGSTIKRDHQPFIRTTPQRCVEKLDCGLLLEPQLIADASARIDQENYGDRQVGLLAEICNGLWSVVLKNLEAVLIEVCDEFPPSVEDCKYHV